ncbi:MAG: ParB/RepB/Spo0J family partition protein [Bacteroidales bacterium]|nr:ParB/RepB/Spo0J family partition protein [Bacteroidales bacterium]
MSKRMTLGRGLGALIEGADTSVRNRPGLVDSISEIDLSLIEVNPYQPRRDFDEEALNELSDSISKLGVIQPITVRLKEEGFYQIISGERRFRASKRAGLKTIPAYVRAAEEKEMMEMALVENIQRDDLNAIEVALSFQRLIEEFALTQESLSERVGKKRTTVTNYLRLLKLPSEIQLGIRDKIISMGHARALLSFEDPETQINVYRAILDEGLSVRKVEEWARQEAQEETPEESPSEKKPARKKTSVPELAKQAGKQLESLFQSKIEIKMKDSSKGKIIINFESEKDLQHIIEQIRIEK